MSKIVAAIARTQRERVVKNTTSQLISIIYKLFFFMYLILGVKVAFHFNPW
jgi:hypothetical protein